MSDIAFIEVVLSKVAGGDQIRTDTVDGHCIDLPVPGFSFMMFDDERRITTSTVKKVTYTNSKEIIFDTLNSTYKLNIK